MSAKFRRTDHTINVPKNISGALIALFNQALFEVRVIIGGLLKTSFVVENSITNNSPITT